MANGLYLRLSIADGDLGKENKDQSKETLKEIYDRIKLPRRATAGSAGYDFFAPVDIILNPGETIKIPTGIRVWMEPEWVLKCYPRSGLGFKFRLQLNNTVGIIDSDYYNSDNEGHIFAKLTNDSNEEKTVPADWITAYGSDVTQDFLDYAAPLIQVTVEIPLGTDGLPDFVYRK